MASAETNAAVPPDFLMAPTRASPRSALRPTTATLAPAAASPSAIAPPSTPVAPITTATSLVRSKRFVMVSFSTREHAVRRHATPVRHKLSSCLMPGESVRFRSMRVALFIPCFIDQLFPNVGIAMVTVLRRLQVEVDYPPEQTCCGQPAFNTGYWHEARALAK